LVIPDLTSRSLKVFLCHSSGDKTAVRELYRKLTTLGIDAWLDEEKLLPGQDWQLEIPKAVQESDAVIVCLSKSSVTKEGYIQKEIKFALDVADEKPEGTIFIIPARLEDCKVPHRFEKWHWVDLFQSVGPDRLIKSLTARAESLGLDPLGVSNPYSISNRQTWGDIEFVRVSAGNFIMGSKSGNASAIDSEKPEHEVFIPSDFYIGRYPITNAQYNQYIQETQPEDKRSDNWQKKSHYPVVNISWYAAIDFCHWLNKTRGKELPKDWQFRLPTEAEWEKPGKW
jgi:hypothetical protein